MPSRYIHNQISKILLGKECNRTHKVIDYPVRFLGRKHRILFHGLISSPTIGLFMDGYKGIYAGLSHVALDYFCSELPALKYLAELFIYLKKKGLFL